MMSTQYKYAILVGGVYKWDIIAPFNIAHFGRYQEIEVAYTSSTVSILTSRHGRLIVNDPHGANYILQHGIHRILDNDTKMRCMFHGIEENPPKCNEVIFDNTSYYICLECIKSYNMSYSRPYIEYVIDHVILTPKIIFSNVHGREVISSTFTGEYRIMRRKTMRICDYVYYTHVRAKHKHVCDVYQEDCGCYNSAHLWYRYFSCQLIVLQRLGQLFSLPNEIRLFISELVVIT